MKVDAKILKEYLQTEFNNTLKRSRTMIKLVSFQGCKMVQHMQINKHNTANKQNKGQKDHTIISVDAEKAYGKI
jgi:hypothetical protein